MGVQNMYSLLNSAPGPGFRRRVFLYPSFIIGGPSPLLPASGPAPLTRGTYRVIILTYEGVALPVALFEER